MPAPEGNNDQSRLDFRRREKVGDAGHSVRRARPARLALLPLAERDRISRVTEHQHGVGHLNEAVSY